MLRKKKRHEEADRLEKDARLKKKQDNGHTSRRPNKLGEAMPPEPLVDAPEWQRAALVPDFRLETIDQAAHMLHHDQPEALAVHLAEFLGP